MIALLVLPLLAPFVATPLAQRVVGRLDSAAALWTLTVTTLVLALSSLAALGTLLIAGALKASAPAKLGQLIHPLSVGPAAVIYPATALSVGMLVACAATVSHSALRQSRQFRAARSQADARPLGGDLCVLDEAHADAYALPGKPGRIVVTTGMLRALAPAEREVLFAHERAHLTGRHHYFLVAADLAAHCHPGLRKLRTAITLTVEHAADEAAASATGDRLLTARAVARAALAGRGAPRSRPSFAPSATTGPVPRRVTALLKPPNRRRLAPAVVALLLCTTASAAGALGGLASLHHRVEIAQGESG
ncbi:M56 family metallopeptidase [Streptomyces sp. NPDC088725]|uniref:M56 family metallopeptidase n=1 Tax=Streptomyces sp. NPDC088725 TaxID=3365873 RepID=UPI00380314A6